MHKNGIKKSIEKFAFFKRSSSIRVIIVQTVGNRDRGGKGPEMSKKLSFVIRKGTNKAMLIITLGFSDANYTILSRLY